MKRLPINNQWVQTNRGDTMHQSPYSYYQGQNQLVGTFNCDFDAIKGHTRVTKLIKTTDATSDSSMGGVPVGFRYFRYVSSSYIFAIAGSYVHKNSGATENGFAVDAITGSPTNCSSLYSDIELFNGFLYVTTANENAYYLDPAISGQWHGFNITGSGSDANKPHMLCNYAGKMYCTYANCKIASWDTGNSTSQPTGYPNTTQYTLQFESTVNILWMRPASTGIWIGTGSNPNYAQKRGVVYFWNGSSAQAQQSYVIEGSVPMACVIKDDVPWITDSNGRLLAYNGGTFKEVGRLPFYNRWPFGTNVLDNDGRFIHPNGMSLINGRINLLIKNPYYEYGSPTPEFMPSGIWEYDESVGLYHKYSPTYTDPTNYYVNDYGQFNVSKVGALSEMKVPDVTNSATGRLLAGIVVNIPNGGSTISTTKAVFTDDTTVSSAQIGGNTNVTQKAGYLVTAKIDSDNITDTWQKLHLRYDQFLNSTDRMVVKYRTVDNIATIITNVLWTSTTTFTTANAAIANYNKGDEVEVISGRSGGLCAHVVSIVNNSGTYTVTVDETAETTDATNFNRSDIRLQNWIKMGADINDVVSQLSERAIGKPSTWVQFKVWMCWKGDNELMDLTVQSIPAISANFKV